MLQVALRRHFSAKSGMKRKLIYAPHAELILPKSLASSNLKLAFPGTDRLPAQAKLRMCNRRAKGLTSTPTPLHDYINFKKMSGNEIILNLDNHVNLTHGELVSGLLELGKRDKQQKIDWNAHPVTMRIFDDMKLNTYIFSQAPYANRSYPRPPGHPRVA